MARIAPSWMAFRASETGATAPAVAAIAFVLFGFIGLAVDTGTWYLARRELQGAADAAALAAAPFASNPAQANTTARAMLTANGVSNSNALTGLATGVWCPSTSLGVGARFRANSLQCPDLPTATRHTAVRVTVRDEGPLILAPLIIAGMQPPVFNVQATAAQVNMAGLTAGSGVLDINQASGVNSVLGALLGTSLNLSALTYQQMLSAQVDALALLDALALRLNLQAGDYEGVLNAQTTVGVILDTAISVLEQQGQTGSISTGLVGAKVIRDLSLTAPRQSVRVGRLLDVGVWKDMPVGQARPTALTAGVDLLQLASAGLQVANGSHALTVATPLNLTLPGLSVALGVESTLIEPPQTAYFTFGPEGTSVHTAQARVLVKATVNALGVLGGDIPIYVEAGSGDARTTSIACYGNPRADARVNVAASASAASLHIGRPTASLMQNFSQPVASTAITPARITVFPITEVQVAGHTSIAQSSGNVSFIQPTGVVSMPASPGSSGFIGRPATTGDPGSIAIPARVGTAVNIAFNSMTLNLCVLGVCTSAVSAALDLLVRPILNSVFSLVSPVITGLLTGLGIHLGYVDVTVPGVRCGQAVLVS